MWYAHLRFLASHEEGAASKVSVTRSICPDIYHPAVARDGLLTRLRIPGGILTGTQCLAAVSLLDATGIGYFQVTNRANLQIRGLDAEIAPWDLRSLIAEKLVSENAAVDGIRNIMASPLAGIDPTELIDVRPLVTAWDEYLGKHPELGVLSNKFSVGFDGGGSVSILDRPNDITLLAISEREFLLHLALGERGEAPVSVGVRVGRDEWIAVLGAIAQAYRQGIEELGNGGRTLRLREVVAVWGVERFLLRLGVYLTQRGTEGTRRYTEGGIGKRIGKQLGVWGQKQAGLSYVGVVLPLGRITSWQLAGLAEIASRDGSGTIRLTPWQNAIVSDVRDEDVTAVLSAIDGLGLKTGANDIDGLLTACAGTSGCQFAAGDTQADAIALSEYLGAGLELDRPLNIHFSGCDKSCAQHYQADIALWGCQRTAERGAGYRLCIGGGDDKFGRELRAYLTPEDVRLAIDRLIRAYQERRLSPQESFRAFTERLAVCDSNRQSLAQLQQIF
jgi:ferredoxin-nitrite reductase